MLHFAFLAAAKAAASCGRRSRASAPFPVSNSEYSSIMVSDSAAAKRSIAALCASIPRPERCCCCVETRRYATARSIQTAYHRMPFGRRAIQSNDIALFMLQQRRQFPYFPAALRHAHRQFNVRILSDVAVGRVTLAPRHVPFSGPLAGQYATLVGIVTAIFAKAAACKWRARGRRGLSEERAYLPRMLNRLGATSLLQWPAARPTEATS